MNQRFSDPKVKPALQAPPGSPYAFDLCVKAVVETSSWSCAEFSPQRPSHSAFVGVLFVIVRHAGNLLTVYVGVSGMVVKKGDKVKRGQEIGKVAPGDPAFVHFEVRNTSKQSFDPVSYLQ